MEGDRQDLKANQTDVGSEVLVLFSSLFFCCRLIRVGSPKHVASTILFER
jgi:hypothetical protein